MVSCFNTDKICIFTNTGNLHQVKATDIPYGKLRDKGTPIDNLSKYDGTKEQIIYLCSAESMKGSRFLLSLIHILYNFMGEVKLEKYGSYRT